MINKKVARLEILKKVMANRSSIDAYEVSVLLNCSVTTAYQTMHTLSLIDKHYEYDRGILRKKQITESSLAS